MNTEILAVSDPAAFSRTAEILHRKASVVMVPTETVYGLVCLWDDTDARKRIYAMKQRDAGKPFAAFVRSPAEAEQLCGKQLPDPAKRFAECFMPGPITLIVPDRDGGTFGFRMPDHPFITSLLEKAGSALASTSANLSGNPPALNVSEGLRDLASGPELAVDAGSLPEGSRASTVVLVSGDGSWKILRQGAVTEKMLCDCLNSWQ